jgi:hypothetical protein
MVLELLVLVRDVMMVSVLMVGIVAELSEVVMLVIVLELPVKLPEKVRVVLDVSVVELPVRVGAVVVVAL